MTDNTSVDTNCNTAILAEINEICSNFEIKGRVIGYSSLKNGHINKTYAVFTEDDNGKERSYILQRINSTVFSNPEIISRNMESITSYIYNKLPNDCDKHRQVERLFKTKDGKTLYKDGIGHSWRLMSYIYNSVCINNADAKVLENTGIAFGRFLANLYDFPIDKLEETIKDFHNTPKRVSDLRDAYERDEYGRRAEVDDACRFIFSQKYYINFFEDAYRSGRLPKRVTHNDTKCNNVMFDASTMEPLAVVDLDTVMPGFVAYDFGDAIRFGANSCAEDDPHIENIELDLEKYEAFCRGYMSEVKGKLTPFEIETLPIGAVTTILEIGSRFLEDYLRGDKYFACHRERHNYDRGMNQVALLRSAISRIDDMKRILKKYSD